MSSAYVEKGASKDGLPLVVSSQTPQAPSKAQHVKWWLIALFRVYQLWILVSVARFWLGYARPAWLYGRDELKADLCPQQGALSPSSEVWQDLVGKQGLYTSDGFGERAVALLGGAIQIKTESFDAMKPVGQDPRWKAFAPFHDYLLKSFPLV